MQLEAPRDSTVVFFQDLPYGSQSLFNPLTVMLNKGYDIVQLSSSSRYIWQFPYRNAGSLSMAATGCRMRSTK